MSDLGRYRIQAVAEMTGVSAATLRQWERRYGIPSPDRTDAAYRIYGEGDVDHVRRMVALSTAGVSPSEAARLIKAEDAERIARAKAATPASETLLDDLDPYVEARRSLIETIEHYDFEGLAELSRKLMYLGSAVSIFERVIAPTMREVGQRWHAGTMSVAQEHLASEIVGQLLHQMLGIVQPEDADLVAVLGCFAEDTHTLPLYGVAFRLAQWGYRTVVLGARTPPSAIASTVPAIEPTVIGLSVTIAPPELEARRLLRAYAEAAGDVPWMVGGRGVRPIGQLVQAEGGFVAPTDVAGLRSLMRRLARGQEDARSG